MKLIIAGSRHFTNLSNEYIGKLIKSFDLIPSSVVCGCARGVDMAGEYWAGLNEIPIVHFHPEWDRYGSKAGPIRNRKMAAFADALLLIWDGESSGSRNMKQEMLLLGKSVYEVVLNDDHSIVVKKVYGKGDMI